MALVAMQTFDHVFPSLKLDSVCAHANHHPFTVSRHIQEIELIRSKVYSLEQSHNQMKAK